ncbi:hypothetical protein PG985_011507 [Apiospora marii]|uniref:uncharacterized protein n=1 Tax=Apiospora marii TaxID=335849 RepID=UPI003131FFCA
MVFEPRDATGEASANATVHGEPREQPVSVTETRVSASGLQIASEPHIVAQPPPTRRDSIASGLEAAMPAEPKMPPGLGSDSESKSGLAAAPPPRPQQHWAGMIPWDKETEQGKTVVQHAGGEKDEGNKRRRRWIGILGVAVLLALASTVPAPTVSDTAPTCPGANNTVYTTPADEGGGTQYRRICGVSYDGNDIQPQKAETMGHCLALCSGYVGGSHCAGVVWYDAGPQGTDLNWCWLKRSMDQAVLSYRDSAQTAIRL